MPVQEWWGASKDRLIARQKSKVERATVCNHFEKKKRNKKGSCERNLLCFKGYRFDAGNMKKREAFSSSLSPVGVL